MWRVLILPLGLNLALYSVVTDANAKNTYMRREVKAFAPSMKHLMRKTSAHSKKHQGVAAHSAPTAHSAPAAPTAHSAPTTKQQPHIAATAKKQTPRRVTIKAASVKKQLATLGNGARKRVVRNAAPKKARPMKKNMVSVGKKKSTAFTHSKAKLLAHQQRRVASLMAKNAKLSAETSSGVGNTTDDDDDDDDSADATNVAEDGQEIAISNASAVAKQFTIGFQVKFQANAFLQNTQEIVGTDKHALLIQGLGPSFVGNTGKIGAWMKTDSGLGPSGKGVAGSDGNGMLLSQVLSPDEWYAVHFQKTLDTLSLKVEKVSDPSDTSTASSAIDKAVLFTDGDFDLEMQMDPSTKITFGHKTATGDHKLLGELSQPTLVEGPPTST